LIFHPLATLLVYFSFRRRTSFKVLHEAFAHRTVLRHRRGRLIDHNDIEALKFVLVLPKGLSGYPLDAVSRRCLATLFLGNGQP